jgi:hypothetical protein
VLQMAEELEGVDEEQKQRERAVRDAAGGQRELAEHREARQRSHEIDIEKVEAARKESEARKAEAREARAREVREREERVAAEKSAFEEKAFAAKRAKEKEPREKEAKVQALRNSHPVSAASQVPTEGAPYAVSKSQEEITNKYVSERYGGTVVTEKRPVPRTFQPTKTKEQERHEPGLQYAERIIPKATGSEMHDVAQSAVEEHEATVERDYLGTVAKATELDVKKKEAKEQEKRRSASYVPQFEKEQRAKTKREEKARQLYNPVENQVVTTTIVEAKEFGHQVGHGGNTTDYEASGTVTKHIPLGVAQSNAEPKKTMKQEWLGSATEDFRTDPLARENLAEHGLHGKSKGYEKGKPNPTPGIPFESFDPNSPTTLRYNENKNQQNLGEFEMKRTHKEKKEEEAERRKKMGSGASVDFESFEEVAKKKAREEQAEAYAKKQQWKGDIDADQFSNQKERQTAHDTVKRNQEMKADYAAGSATGGVMGTLKNIISHPHDAAQELGYAVEKKVGQHTFESKQAARASAASKLTPEYAANDQKYREGKISKEMHEMRAKQLDQKFEKMSTPLSHKVAGGLAVEAGAAFGILNESFTSPEGKKLAVASGKPRAMEGNTITATFARGIASTVEQAQKKPKHSVVGQVWHQDILPPPSRKEFGGKGTRKTTPTKGTVVSKGKTPGINFGGGGFGSPIAFGSTISRSPAMMGNLFGRGQPEPAPAPAPTQRRRAPVRRR